jgi:hypothetical protein
MVRDVTKKYFFFNICWLFFQIVLPAPFGNKTVYFDIPYLLILSKCMITFIVIIGNFLSSNFYYFNEKRILPVTNTNFFIVVFLKFILGFLTTYSTELSTCPRFMMPLSTIRN